jgi:tetratricopeptide (TPR) repeat protein
MKLNHPENLDPQNYVFWRPPEGHVVCFGADQEEYALPQVPLPIKIKNIEGEEHPSDNAVGEGVYDYLREFPDCQDNTAYAEILRDAYSHYLADLGAHAVMLDAKDVESSYIYRKLSYLKILHLLEPENEGLSWQLAEGFYSLAMTFTELAQVRRYLLQAMRYGQNLIKMYPDNQGALNLLAEIDILFGDYPMATNRLNRLLGLLDDVEAKERLQERIDRCMAVGFPDHPLVDDLEQIANVMELYSVGNFTLATEMLERLEEDEYFVRELKSADFMCLLGMCRLKTNDNAGAFDALTQAVELDPEHEKAKELLDSI